MSYEGREQILCANGHLDVVDDSELCEIDPEAWRCEYCDARAAWSNSIDETNGLPYPHNCEVLLKVTTPRKWILGEDGKGHWVPAIYEIPNIHGARGSGFRIPLIPT
jgi:hypothetical protein